MRTGTTVNGRADASTVARLFARGLSQAMAGPRMLSPGTGNCA